MFLAEIRNEAAKPKVVEEGYNAGAGDTVIVEALSRVASDGLADYRPGFAINFPTTPADGDVIRVIVKGYGHTQNAVSIRAQHPIDFRTTAQIPDATYVNQFLGDPKTLLLSDDNLETVFVYNGISSKWDSSTSAASLDFRRLRPTEAELATKNVQLVTCDFQPAMWDNPFNYDPLIAQESVYGWSAPTAAANHLGFIENRYGFQTNFGDGADFPSSGIYVQGDPQWHDHQYDGNRPANTVTRATQAAGAVTDFGWYFGTNATGAADADPFAGGITVGTTINNFLFGYRAFNSQIGQGALNATATSVSYNTQDTFPDPLANEGYAATLNENFDVNFQIVRDDIANNRPFFVCWKHWNITEKTTPANKLPPETVGGTSMCKSLPVKFYNWGAVQTTGPFNEQYYVGGVDDFESSVGHWTLCVGYIEVGAGYAATPENATHPHISPSSKYLIVVDDNAMTDANGASALNGMEQRVLKAIPVIENGVTTGRTNLMATIHVDITQATYAV